MKFTDKYLKGLTPKPSSYRIFEKGTDKGFGLKITPAGSITFIIQYTIDGKKQFYNLGRYPSVSLADAREKCREIRTKVDSGIDPRRATDEQFGKVSDLFTYYSLQMQLEGKRTWDKVEADLIYNCQSIMNMPANEVEPIHIRKILRSIIQRGSEVQSNRVRTYLKRAFKLGIFHDNDPKTIKNDFVFNIKANPVDAVPNNIGAESVGTRTLDFNEIKLLWNDGTMNVQFILATKLILIYGCRTMELCGAEKEEFDFESKIWSLPPERVKNKRWHLLPITPVAEALIRELFDYSGLSKYLIPGRYNDKKTINESSLAHAMKRITVIDRFTPRDLRRTVKTRMGEIGIEKSVRDRIQNHAISDVSSKHYDRYDYLPEKKRAIEQWERYLEALVAA